MTFTKAKVSGALLVPSSSIMVSDVDGPTVMARDADGTLRIVRVTVLALANSKAAIRPIDYLPENTQNNQDAQNNQDSQDDQDAQNKLVEGTEVRMY